MKNSKPGEVFTYAEIETLFTTTVHTYKILETGILDCKLSGLKFFHNKPKSKPLLAFLYGTYTQYI